MSKTIVILSGIISCFFWIMLIIINNLVLDIIFCILGSIFSLLFLFMLIIYVFLNYNDKNIQHKFWNLLIERTNWQGSGKAIDIGTGAGALAIKLAMKFPEIEVIGIDNWGIGWNYSQKQCESNAKLAGVHDRVKFIKASAESIPFENEEFDLVVSNFVLHEVRNVKNKVLLIQEIIRILKPGGKFLIQDEFYKKKHYGDIEQFISKVQKLGLKKITLEHTPKELNFSIIISKMFYAAGILIGIK